MIFVAQVALLVVAAIVFAIVVDRLLPPSAFTALSTALDFESPARCQAPSLTSTLTGNESDVSSGTAGDHFTH